MSLLKKFLADDPAKVPIEILENHLKQEKHYDLPATLADTTTCLSEDCQEKQVHVTQNVFTDIEMFISYDGTNSNTVYDAFAKHMHLCGSKELCKTVLNHPINDVNILSARQECIQYVCKNFTNLQKSQYEKLSTLERHIHWLFEDTDENLQMLYDMVYFRFFILRPLNSQSKALTAINLYQIFLSPTIGIVSPIIYFVAPYLILKYKFGDVFNFGFVSYLKFMFNTFIKGGGITDILIGGGSPGIGSQAFRWISFAFSLLFYFQGIFNSVEVSKSVYKISQFLTNKAQQVIEAMRIAEELLRDLWTDSMTKYFVDIGDFINIEKENELFESLPDSLQFSVLSDFGKSLKFIKTLDKNAIRSVMARLYVVDMLSACCSKLQSNKSICYTSFMQDDNRLTPYVCLTNTWHPCLNEDTTVKNSILIDAQNIILTGPNAGGKSTFIKTVIVNILLSQTLGIAFAEKCLLQPFSTISTQINVPDTKGKESLFEAEMHRCKTTLDLIGKPGIKLVVMDEIFNSTNPVEGIAGAYAVAKKISEHNDTLLIFTTHFVYLTKLSKYTQGRFINYRMNVDKDMETSRIKFPYILQPGVSKQYVALELLKLNGFDNDLIEEALRIKDRLCSRPRSESQQKSV